MRASERAEERDTEKTLWIWNFSENYFRYSWMTLPEKKACKQNATSHEINVISSIREPNKKSSNYMLSRETYGFFHFLCGNDREQADPSEIGLIFNWQRAVGLFYHCILISPSFVIARNSFLLAEHWNSWWFRKLNDVRLKTCFLEFQTIRAPFESFWKCWPLF